MKNFILIPLMIWGVGCGGAHLVYSADGGVSCSPTTCAQLGYNCGLTDDGCGGAIQCGTCPNSQYCGTYNKCAFNTTSGSAPSNTGAPQPAQQTNGSSGSSSGTTVSGSTTAGSGSAVNYGPWSNCFDPSESYPTGVLKYPDCATYCQSVGKTCSTTACIGPDPGVNTYYHDSMIAWCGFPAGTCGDIKQYPDYISSCDLRPSNVTMCVYPYVGCTGGNPWLNAGFACGTKNFGPPTSVQCCCQ